MFTPVSAFTAAKLSRNSIAMTNVCQKKKKKKKNTAEALLVAGRKYPKRRVLNSYGCSDTH